MQPTLIVLLFIFTVLAVLGYYIGFIQQARVLQSRSQTLFIIMTFVLIPLLVVVLRLQTGARRRLENTGITPHPAIRNAIGVTFGAGESPTWLFNVGQARADILNFDVVPDFDVVPENRDGWHIVSQSETMVVLVKSERAMTILVSDSKPGMNLAYMLTTKES